MKRRISIGLVVCLALAVMGVGLSLAQGRQAQAERGVDGAGVASTGGAAWIIERVDSPDVGEHVSVAVHPQTGVTYVSYYDEFTTDLYLATHVGSGGDCGPSNSWKCKVLDGPPQDDVGQFNSIAIYPGGSSLQDRWKLGIAYYDGTNYGLKFAEYAHATFPTPGYSWNTWTIISGNGVSKPGLFTSLKYTSSGVPHIAHYHSVLSGADSLRHAYRIGSGGNCGPSNTWQCDTVDTGEGVGQYASLDLDSNGNPWIAYYDATNDYPKLANYNGSTWSFWRGPVDRPFLDTGKHVSFVLDDSDVAHIAYYNATDVRLEYAKFVSSGGNCGYDSLNGYKWQCDRIEGVGTLTGYRPVSIALDGGGYPIIAYQDASGATLPAMLKVARPIGALGPPIPYSGNCGPQISPPPNLRRSWQCDTVDGGGSNTDEGASVSLAVDSNGLAIIAYHEHRLMIPESVDRLKVAYQRWSVYLPLVLKDSP